MSGRQKSFYVDKETINGLKKMQEKTKTSQSAIVRIIIGYLIKNPEEFKKIIITEYFGGVVE